MDLATCQFEYRPTRTGISRTKGAYKKYNYGKNKNSGNDKRCI